MQENAVSKTISYDEFLPKEWLRDDTSKIYISCYLVMYVPQNYLDGEYKVIDLGKVIALVFHGENTEKARANVNIFSEDSINLQVETSIDGPLNSKGTWLYLISPTRVNGKEFDENYIQHEIKIALSSLIICLGRNIAYKHAFDNIISRSGEVSFSSPVFENPSTFPRPDLSEQRILLVENVSRSVSFLDEKIRNRVHLSMHWHSLAKYTTNGIDSFIKMWIALETLSMPNTTNIRPINDALGQIYGCDQAEANKKFLIGKLFKIRSNIVHDGLVCSMHCGIIEYIEDIYVDILFNLLNIKNEKRSHEALISQRYNLNELIHFVLS